MTHHSQTVTADQQNNDDVLSLSETNSVEQEAQHYRCGAYSMLARLLRSPPDQSVMDQVADFAGIVSRENEMALAMSMLGLAAKSTSPAAADDEFHALFIGIGRGELVPYGSWYLTGFLMERPLGRLREDLSALGFQRREGVSEPEDHVAALCEVMAALIADESFIHAQAQFFTSHMADWLAQFFTDLSESNSAVFYKAVGRFGVAFAELEKRYFSMPV
jgi:TorA maturation chaperone TorD